MSTPKLQVEEIAEKLYEQYCQAVGGKAFNGDTLPDWKTFRADSAKAKQSDAWMVVGKVAEDLIDSSAGEKIELSKNAVNHALKTICDDPAKFWLLGDLTETYSQLTAAYAVLYGRDVEQVRNRFMPDEDRYLQYCTKKEEEKRLLEYCREKGIKPE